MKNNIINIIKTILFYLDYIFENLLYLFYILYFFIFLYYLTLYTDKTFFIFNKNTYNTITQILEIVHFLFKLTISLYLVLKFSPYINIKYTKRDRKIFFNSGFLLLTSIILFDPLILINY